MHLKNLPQTKCFLRNFKNIHYPSNDVGNDKIIVSGIQPTGNFHIGNYFGAINSWVKEHAELCWILSCFTTLAKLNYMPVWKEKGEDSYDNEEVKKGGTSLSLFSYPVLQAADILLYKATHVPIGEDQLWHLHLTQHLVQKFNNIYKKDYFTVPKPLLGKITRVKALRNPVLKMSKSDSNINNRIELLDEPDEIRRKINKAFTDSNIPSGSLVFSYPYHKDQSKSPEITGLQNLFNIYTTLKFPDHNFEISNMESTEITFDSVKHMKEEISHLLIKELLPIRTKILDLLPHDPENNKIMDDKKFMNLCDIINEGSELAKVVASRNLVEIKNLIGFL
ncbi:tryptophan--tRNA ligase-like isoform X2 [Gordionus sp. m RMFG-2023]|uniref:tryptophan--tRNA ligase-like isoform X2 n=1 Tax=Gordionus sp. m RMFG-2023 TaxID=3053472 RepID=UPI0031FC55C4